MQHVRRQQSDSAVMVFVVVPGEEALAKGTCILDGSESVGEPARVPRPIRIHRGCTCLLPALLPLVQPRTPSQRNRSADAGHAALRHGITGHRAATKRPRPSLSSYPGTLRPNPTKAPAPAHCGLDQPAYINRDRRFSTLNSDATCLTIVDTLRRDSETPDRRSRSFSLHSPLQGLKSDSILIVH